MESDTRHCRTKVVNQDAMKSEANRSVKPAFSNSFGHQLLNDFRHQIAAAFCCRPGVAAVADGVELNFRAVFSNRP